MTNTSFSIQDEGTLVLVHPNTDTAREFLGSLTTSANHHMRWGKAFAVEHRYAEDFIANLQEEGFTVS